MSVSSTSYSAGPGPAPCKYHSNHVATEKPEVRCDDRAGTQMEATICESSLARILSMPGKMIL